MMEMAIPIKDISELVNEDVSDKSTVDNDTEEFKSSFDYHAVPLDEQMTLDENGVPFTLKELMELNDLHSE